MTNVKSKSESSPLRERIILLVLGSVLSLGGKFLIDKAIESRTLPVIVKDLYQPDLSSFPPELRQQVYAVPVKYSLQHKGGAAAKNVAILVRSSTALPSSELKFSSDSEPHQAVQTDPNTIRVEIPTLRPSASVSFQMATTVSNTVSITEISDEANFLTTAQFTQKALSSDELTKVALISLGAVVWVAVLGTMVLVLLNLKKWWLEIETDGVSEKMRNRILGIIVGLMIYNTVMSAFGVFGGFLPLPRIPFDGILYGFLLFILFTRYKAIDNWLSSKTKGPANETNSTPEGKLSGALSLGADKHPPTASSQSGAS